MIVYVRDVTDGSKISAKLKAVADPATYAALFQQNLQAILQTFRDATPVGDSNDPHHGELKAGWNATVLPGKPNPSSVTLQVTNSRQNSSNILSWLRQGTARHLIKPRSKHVLSFVVKGDSVVTKLVRHPGTKPVKSLGADLNQKLTAQIGQIVKAALKT